MTNELLNLIPNDILNLIWEHISPKCKYILNKYYFNKYYSYRFYSIHNNKIGTIANLQTNIFNNFNNYNYYYYILISDLIYFSKIILTLYISNNTNNSISYYTKKFVYKNIVFTNLVDFFYYYCNNKNKNEIINIINKYNLSHLIKKSHKNNVNKNIRWTL